MQANEAEPDFEGDPIEMDDYGNLLTALSDTLAVLPCVMYVMADNACGCENDNMISDHAKWNKHDKNIPKNSVGEVMGYGEKKNEAGYDVEDESIIQLQFAKGGQWWPFPVEELTKVKGKMVKKRLGAKRDHEVYQDTPAAKEPKEKDVAAEAVAFDNPLMADEEEVAPVETLAKTKKKKNKKNKKEKEKFANPISFDTEQE